MARKKQSTTETLGNPEAKRDTSTSMTSKGAWRALDASSALLAGLAAPRLAKVIWRAATGKSAPRSTRSAEITMTEAILWAAVAGALAQVLRTVAARTAASYWQRSTGSEPPPAKTKHDK